MSLKTLAYESEINRRPITPLDNESFWRKFPHAVAWRKFIENGKLDVIYKMIESEDIKFQDALESIFCQAYEIGAADVKNVKPKPSKEEVEKALDVLRAHLA